jgi:serine/threonine protein kinase
VQPDPPVSGALIAGRYQLSKRIGEGRTGQVFRARDAKTGERVAVKLLHKPLCIVPEPVRRFAREFEATSRIDHPNVVRSIAFGQESDGEYAGTHYLVMELLDGRKLDDVLKAGRLDADRAVRIALDVAKALAAAHELGIVHRDVEPSNVVLSRSKGKEIAKVLDFGLARLQSSNEEALTDVGVRLGTPEYMSPEYVESGDLEPRSDVYALGVLLYTMLTGVAPFVGRTLSVMQNHVHQPVTPPSSWVPGLAPWLEALILEMLSKQPEHRPSATEVVERLSAALPALNEEVGQERKALASFEPEAMPPMAAVHHHSFDPPVYPDPKPPVPRTPILVTVGLLGFGLVGLCGFFSILVGFIFL